MLRPIRTLSFLGLVLAAVVATYAGARAAETYCPASVSIQSLGDPNPGYSKNVSGTLFTLVLRSENARALSGTVAVQTTTGWFAIAIPNVQLQLTQEQYSDAFGTFSRDVYFTFPIFVRFPSNVQITYAYLKDAQVLGYPAAGCPGNDDDAIVGPSAVKQPFLRNAVTDMMSHETPLQPPPGEPVLSATPMAAPGSTSCSQPFADATMTMPYGVAPPNGNAPGRTIVGVAISASGSVDRVWMWRSSGSRYYDSYALYAAQHSQYSPKYALCHAVPGVAYVLTDYKAK